jgi:diguanylate cyclase (GGDEF)-like protein
VIRIYDQDFRYLLAQLVPQHRLSPDLRRDVDRALRGSVGAELRRQSVRALEALCDSAYFEHAGLSSESGNVVVAYRRPRGAMRVSLALPQAEWDALTGATTVEKAPDGPGAPGLPRLKRTDTANDVRPTFGALELLPEITRSFAISDGVVPVLDRLDALIATLETWLGFTGGHLDVLEDTLVVHSDERGERVRVVTDEALRESQLVRAAVEAGSMRYADTGPGGDGPALGVAPILLFGKVVGALQARFGALERPAMDARLDVAAGVVRSAIEFSHQFASLTSIDSLTGVYNRQFLDRQLPVEIERAMRSGAALSMLVIDVDDFKRINDELGHKKGDEALVAITEIIRRNLRKVDMPFRYGGEEIVILLPGTPEFEALHTAERLRRVVNQYRGFKDAGGGIRDLAVSVGVAVYPDTARSGEQLFAQADEAMYRAKQRGKNQVVLYSKK